MLISDPDFSVSRLTGGACQARESLCVPPFALAYLILMPILYEFLGILHNRTHHRRQELLACGATFLVKYFLEVEALLLPQLRREGGVSENRGRERHKIKFILTYSPCVRSTFLSQDTQRRFSTQ
jgi:hypothetical protein